MGRDHRVGAMSRKDVDETIINRMSFDFLEKEFDVSLWSTKNEEDMQKMLDIVQNKWDKLTTYERLDIIDRYNKKI